MNKNDDEIKYSYKTDIVKKNQILEFLNCNWNKSYCSINSSFIQKI